MPNFFNAYNEYAELSIYFIVQLFHSPNVDAK